MLRPIPLDCSSLRCDERSPKRLEEEKFQVLETDTNSPIQRRSPMTLKENTFKVLETGTFDGRSPIRYDTIRYDGFWW